MKLIIFDLDGVLVDTKDLHYKALNDALPEQYIITPEEHIDRYDGLPTVKKLEMLTREKGLPICVYEAVYAQKQELTQVYIKDNISINPRLRSLLESLSDDGYILHCASNAIRESVFLMLQAVGLFDMFEFILSNEDVDNPKPNPEMYLRCMVQAGVGPKETLIVEDSPRGIEAAINSGASVLMVKNPEDLTMDKIFDRLQGKSKADINILIPMAGEGSRFKEAGYTFPKPIVDVNGKPMIQVVVESLGFEANYIFVVQKSHCEDYNLKTMLQLIAPGCTIVVQEGKLDGAVMTTLLAKEYIDDKPLILANSDQYIEWSPMDFYYKMIETKADGGILTFRSTHPKWSYVRLEGDNVVEVAEKDPISDNATVGVYYWSKGTDYVKYAEQMVDKNIRVKGEFYVAPVFNEAIADGKKIKTFDVDVMKGMGTPEDLDSFLRG